MFYTLTVALLSSATTQAAGVYFAGGSAGGALGSFQLPTDSYEITSIGIPAGSELFVNYDDPATLGVGSSEASIFGLKSSSYARAVNESNFPLNFDFTFSNSTNAIAVWSDFIVTGPAGPSTVPISVNALIDGSILASMGSGSSPTSRLGGSVEFYIESGLSGGFWNNSFGGTYGLSITPSGGPVYDRTGLLANFDGSTVVTTGVFNVPVNTPFAIRFGMNTTTVLRTEYGSVFSMEVGVDFSHTAKFVTDGPAFNLPAGYTINSVDAGIVNNAYVAVPEPSTLWLSAFGVGTIFIGAIARRRVS
ncbi:MAG: PEP-CTERM sorting domain-containing protein [Pirellulales bacterium]|nr:PEP-CTERM sorting domain-containing protein [Pirellulales bacterium]